MVFAGLTLAWAYVPNLTDGVFELRSTGAIAPGIAWTLAVLALLGAGAGYLGFTTGMGFASGVSLIQVGVFGLGVTTKMLAAASPLAGQATFGSGLVFGAATTVVGLIGIVTARDGMVVTPAPPLPSLVGLLGGLGGLLFAAAWLAPVLGFLSFRGGASVLMIYWFWVSPILVALVVPSVLGWRSGSDYWPSVALPTSTFMVLIALANPLATVGAVVAFGAAAYGGVLTACRQVRVEDTSVTRLRSIGSKPVATVAAAVAVAAAAGLLVSSAGITWLALNNYSRSTVDVNVPGSSDGPFAGPTTIISTDGLGPSFSDLSDGEQFDGLVPECATGLMSACDEGFRRTNGDGKVGEYFARCGVPTFSTENGGSCEARFAAGQAG